MVLGIISATVITLVKAKNSAVLLINAANLYLFDHFEPYYYTNSVGFSTLIQLGYLEIENLVNDCFWIIKDKNHHGLINGIAYT